jgi:hypothetical protein
MEGGKLQSSCTAFQALRRDDKSKIVLTKLVGRKLHVPSA